MNKIPWDTGEGVCGSADASAAVHLSAGEMRTLCAADNCAWGFLFCGKGGNGSDRDMKLLDENSKNS